MLYPLTFHPIFKERVWGGRRLVELYGKDLPQGARIGESWEITDRPEGLSVIANGPLAGRDLRWLMENHRDELLGSAQAAVGGRFPLLVKILDAHDKLSLQVHPPPHKAAELGGEPKTEMWYVADATPDADIFVGLRRGTTREEFEKKIANGSVADCFHRHVVKQGDVMFLPSGRVHALGAGSVIFEIQQNSDTTYRVFDWNRVGLDGKPRELHVAQALEAIDFEDFEPALVAHACEPNGSALLADNELFEVRLMRASAGQGVVMEDGGLQVLALTAGKLEVGAAGNKVPLRPGQFCVLPASCAKVGFWAEADSTWLLARPK